MSVSESDVSLVIFHKGKTQYWSGFKGCGSVILDKRFGLYAAEPAPDLSWIAGSYWEEVIYPTATQIKVPEYGELLINFDKKLIVDSTGFGSPFELSHQWFLLSWKKPNDAPLALESLIEHLSAQRIRALKLVELESAQGAGTLLPKDADEAREYIGLRNGDFSRQVVAVRVDPPDGWKILIS